MPRLLDVVFFFYFLTHIPISVLIDFQGLFPAEYFPQQLRDVKAWYCNTFRDPMMVVAPEWFKSLIVCELVLQLPFFFVATYGFFKGASKCKWLRLPIIIYGTHVATTLIPIFAHILLFDFSKEKFPHPRNMEERLRLLSIYSPYLFIPIVLVLDACFSSAYRYSSTEQQRKKMK